MKICIDQKTTKQESKRFEGDENEGILSITRTDFMSAFRDDEFLSTLTTEDRLEIFKSILTGSSDITKELLNNLLTDYCVEGVEIK